MGTRREKRVEGVKGTAVVEASKSKEFRKTNEAIGLRIKEGKYSLLTRKIFNVMMFRAQEQREPGKNAPLVTPTSDKYFWIPVAALARDTAYNSRDIELLKQQAEELMNIKVVMENERQWTSERLVSSVTFVNPSGLHVHGGQLWLGYSFPPEVHQLVMAPGTYTRLSIVYQGLLRSGSALSLYEVCRRYATNPSNLTNIQTVEHWYSVLTGNPVGVDEMPQYKYLKRDVIIPAVNEVNALTDIKVALVEHKKGRKVISLQFHVELAQQTKLEISGGPAIDSQLIDGIVSLGFAASEAQDLVGRYSDAELQSALDFVRNRMAQTGGAPLDSPAAYFKWALKEGIRGAPLAALPVPVVSKEAVATKKAEEGRAAPLMERFLAARTKDALVVYVEMAAEEKAATFARFTDQANSVERMAAAKGADSAMVRSLLGRWLAREMWGEPTAADLARFVENLASYSTGDA